MPTLTIRANQYSFPISQPYFEGGVLGEAEAKILNGLRSDRIRNIIYKKLEKLPDELTTQELLALESDIRVVDETFEFRTYENRRAKKLTLEDSIDEVALERVKEMASQLGEVLTDTLASARASILRDDPKIVLEAKRRFEIQQTSAAQALADLL